VAGGSTGKTGCIRVLEQIVVTRGDTVTGGNPGGEHYVMESADVSAALTMTCVARTGNVELWRVDFGIAYTMAGRASNTKYQWRLPAEMLHDDH